MLLAFSSFNATAVRVWGALFLDLYYMFVAFFFFSEMILYGLSLKAFLSFLHFYILMGIFSLLVVFNHSIVN